MDDRQADDRPRDVRARVRPGLRPHVRSRFASFGPGLVTGVADDDPSGVSTYTVTGATSGYSLLWTSLVTLPLNIAVQAICARIGIVTGRGLAEVIARHYGRRWLYPIVVLLFIANAVNIGADLGAIAASIQLIVPVNRALLVVLLGVGIALVEVVVPYTTFARILKVLTLVVFAYVIGAFVARPDWGAALRGTLVPQLDLQHGGITTLVALLGTTISPYLFFWQTSQEVEEEHEQGIELGRVSRERGKQLAHEADRDVALGMVVANVGFYFVVLTSAATLFRAGRTDVTTAAQAAEALRPLAGPAASWLFAAGIIGTGLLAIPVLAGAVAYASAELFGWREGLNRTFPQAPQFYGVIGFATLVGIGIVFSPLPEITALYIAAVVNGVIAPVLLVFVMVVARDRRVMGERVPGPLLLGLGWLTVGIMGAAAVALFAVR